MTHKTIISLIILMMIFSVNNSLNAAGNKKNDMSSGKQVDVISGQAHTGTDHGKPAPAANHPQPMSHPRRISGPSLEELPHIHHFHKNRMKRYRLHLGMWMIAKLILVLCHIGLLILGYIHATH